VDAANLTKEALVIDSHNDTIVAHIRAGRKSLFGDAAGTAPQEFSTIEMLRGPMSPSALGFQIDFCRMAAAGIDAAFFAIDVTLAAGNRLTYAMDGLGFMLADIARSDTPVRVVRASEDIKLAKAQGELSAVLAIEHADCVERSLYVLNSLHALGVRSIGLTHNISSLAADGCLEARAGVGLTSFGVAMVKEMNRLGMVVDLAHVSPGAFYHALDVSTAPVLFSHGNARALCDHPRNLTDDQLRQLGQQGGVIGLSYVPMFVDAREPTLERLLDHVDHIADVAGIETVGLGSDFDGGGTLLKDASETVRVTDGLLSRGYSQDDVRRVLGLNTLRLLGAAIG